MEKVYEIMVNPYGDKKGHSQFLGLSFATEEVAQKFISTYLKPVERKFYSIRERETSEAYRNVRIIYTSLDQLSKAQPRWEISKLEVDRKEILSNVKLPFTLSLEVVSWKEEKLTKNISSLPFSELSKFIKYLTGKLARMIKEEPELLEDDYIFQFIIHSYDNKNQSALGSISYAQIKLLQALFASINEKTQEIDEKIAEVRKRLKGKPKDNDEKDL